MLGIEASEGALSNLYYEISDLIRRGEMPPVPQVASVGETIEKLLHSDLSIARFGDGEFKFMFLKGSIGFQQQDERLAARLREVFVTRDENPMIAVQDFFGFLGGGKSWFRPLVCQIRPHINPLFDFQRLYYNTGVTRNITSAEHFTKLKRLWHEKDVVLVEGSMCRMGIGNDLFDNVRSLRRILAPAENAFRVYEEILEKTSSLDKGVLFLIALGPTATVLAYDLARRGFRALDVGHLDICYELFLRGATEMQPIEGKYVNEVSYRSPTDCRDEKYLSSILCHIK